MERMKRTILVLAAVAAAGVCGVVWAGDSVGVPGSSNKFPTSTEIKVEGKTVKLNLTGAALRKRVLVDVYVIGSYLQDGATAKTAEQLAGADAVKVLHLIMERDVKGKDMAEAIQTGVKLNNPGNAFEAELKQMVQKLSSMELRKGDHVFLVAIPKVGVRCQVGKTEILIENPMLNRAIWDIYLGKQNLGEPIKTSLVSRL